MTQALALGRREHRESDRIAVLFTREYGKLPVRFVSVEKPRAKLRALAEPLVLGEYRLYVRDGAEHALCVGGLLETSFPRVRADLDLTLRAFEVLELLDRMTPSWKPAEAKFLLTERALRALESASEMEGRRTAAAWVAAAYGLRLLEAAGFGMGHRKVSEKNRELWERLHGAEFSELMSLPPDAGRLHRLDSIVRRVVEDLTRIPLRSRTVREQLSVGPRPDAAQRA